MKELWQGVSSTFAAALFADAKRRPILELLYKKIIQMCVEMQKTHK